MRVVILRGRVSIGHFVRGSVDMRDVVRITCIFFLLFLLKIHCSCTLGLVTIFDIHCTYSSLYVDVCVSFSFTYPLHVLFLFSLYFYFTQKCLDEFCLKCFRNTGCQSLLVKVYKWIWVECFMTSLISHLFVVVLSWIAKGGDC